MPHWALALVGLAMFCNNELTGRKFLMKMRDLHKKVIFLLISH